MIASFGSNMENQKPSIQYFKEVEIAKPSDTIIKQIRDLISSGILRPGDRLPSERTLSERLRVGRGHVREALKKLEFYGILRTLPQSGTVVLSLGVRALEGLITHVLDLHGDDLSALMEARAGLETLAARLAARRATDADLQELTETHLDFKRKVEQQESGLDEDLLFHIKIAECCKNSVIRSLITLITPDILTSSRNRHTCDSGRPRYALGEHEEILNAIRDHDPEKAAEAMSKHMIIWEQLPADAKISSTAPFGSDPHS